MTFAQSEPIDAFWQWWSGAAQSIVDSLHPGADTSARDALTERVKAIHPELVWSIRPQGSRAWTLCVSGGGNFALRRLAEAWRRAAPESSEGWTYVASRVAAAIDPELVLHVSGTALPVREVALALQENTVRARADIGVFHPALRSMEASGRSTAARLLVDLALGEDDVERWVGDVEPLLNPPSRSLPLGGLARAISRLATKGQEHPFAMLQGRTENGEVMVAMLALSLKRIDHLRHDHHLEVVVRTRNPRPHGLPDDADLPLIRAMEDELVEALRSREEVFFGHLLHGGNVKILFYVQDRARAEAATEEWLRRHSDREIQLRWRHDPTWEGFRQF